MAYPLIGQSHRREFARLGFQQLLLRGLEWHGTHRWARRRLADRNAIRPKPKSRPDEIGQRRGAVLGAERQEIGRGALQLARVLDQHHAVAGPGDLSEERVDQGGLAGRHTVSDEDALPLADAGA